MAQFYGKKRRKLHVLLVNVVIEIESNELITYFFFIELYAGKIYACQQEGYPIRRITNRIYQNLNTTI